MEGLIKKLGQFSVGPILGAVLGFITVPVITYFITPDEYGRASMFTLAISILQMFVFLGMDHAYTKRYYESEDKIKLLTNAMLPSIVLVTLIDIVIFIFRKNVSLLLFDTDGEMLCIYALMVILPGLAAEKFALMDIRMQQKGLLLFYDVDTAEGAYSCMYGTAACWIREELQSHSDRDDTCAADIYRRDPVYRKKSFQDKIFTA